MHTDPLMPPLALIIFIVFLLGVIMHQLKQPFIVGYLIAGIFVGPHGFAILDDEQALSHMGSIGVLLLLFFIGMEISLPRLLENWKIAIFGTLFQILSSIISMVILGIIFDWPVARIVILGFVISLSSTAVVIKILQAHKVVDSTVGRDILGILLVQDLALIPMMITIDLISGRTFQLFTLLMQIIGGILLVGIITYIIKKGTLQLTFMNRFNKDHELQVFTAFIYCFGLAFLSGLFGLSTALGAFFAGIIIASSPHLDWVRKHLEPFNVVFVAIFFLSIGMIFDFHFLIQYYPVILIIVCVSFLLKTTINFIILKLLKRNARESVYGGMLLSQIGEFSFILAAMGLQISAISAYGYQLIISVIFLTLLISPFWANIGKKFIKN